ncbi:MAG: type IX secretion system sortase PorU [Bacteroidota bacterium]|nr:type IX secretion system sortase PorU [Bacteroidota bacterium]
MKYRISFFLFSFFCVSFLSAQTEQITSHRLNWKGVEKWVVGTSSINVIAFDSAQYPMENHLPYFNRRLICDPAFSYQALIKNPVYIPLTQEENVLLAVNSLIPNNPDITTSILHDRGTSFLNVSILPFVKQGGNILKLQSFDLQISKTTLPQKVASTNSRTYVTNSVLSQGRFVKIRIKDSGIYKLTYEDLSSMGIDPANVRIFGYGGAVLEQSFLLPKLDDLPEVAIYMNKGSDGIFNSGDYILFYAQGINKWSYDTTKSMFIHTINNYSNYAYYFVSSDAGVGKKIGVESIVLPNSPTINTVEEFIDYQVHEKDLVNLTSSGKEFYGETFSDVTTYALPFSFPNAVLSNSTTVRLDVAATSSASSNFSLDLNGGQSKTLNVSGNTNNDNYIQGIGATGIFNFTPQSDVFNFNITYLKSTSTSVGYLNYLEVNARRKLIMNGSAMQFQNVDYLGQSSYNQYLLSNANANVQIWDITDKQNISKITTGNVNGKISFVDSGNDVKSYLAIDPTASSSFQKPDIIGVVPNQNLHAITQADMVIITHPNFLSQAQTLAQAHREKDKMTVSVVTTDQVYNEFSSGAPDATAYRWIMKMLYDRALQSNNKSELPKYLLLFGKGSYDNRDLRTDSGNSFILTYQAENSLVTTSSYVTDDYFTLLDDNEGTQVSSDLMNIGVGRFTTTTSQQATDVVNKTIDYMNNQGKGYWKNQLCFVADDDDHSLHSTQADSIAVSLTKKFPSFQVNKIYLDAYVQEVNASGQSYPLAKNHLLNLLRSGLFLLNYTGHASLNGWANEGILTLNDIKVLTNKHLPLFVAATCDFVQFDQQTLSAGEEVVFNPTGGGVGILAAARPVYASQNFNLDKLFCETLFSSQNGDHQRIGDIIAYTKNNLGTETNKLSYVFVGDPAIKLNYPTEYQVLTTKINESTVFGNDTLRALSVDTIQGIIADANGTKIDNFNGTLHAIVYDKVQRITTLNNEGQGSMTYSDRPNTLFSGDVKVVKGAYSFSFMLPKDIRYNFGGGRINYYANDDTNNFEAQGYFENFTIGGMATSYAEEADGPKADLYLNSENFVSGDKVNETPLFIANVSDSDGINTVGSGIGHDVMLTIDQDPTQSYVLNDYFQANTDSYSSGVVKYKLPLMEDGKHTLTFRVWDLLNNSTTSSINFEVVKGLTPEIFTVYNSPNPVQTKTNIIIKHDRPETVLSTTVDIFDISGRKIWSFTQSGTDNISWDTAYNNGQRVKTGVYFYRVSIKTTNSDSTSKTNKMLVVGQ